MPDPIFADPRLAQVYDAFDADRTDLDAYVDMVHELGARRVLDVGCGTGSLAVRLAQRGIEVVALDPATASIEVGRRKTGAGGVTWIDGDLDDLPPDPEVDLAVMTGNVAQVFLTDDAWGDVLSRIAGALRARGHLVFETRRPERRIWEDWAGDRQERRVSVAELGLVTEVRELTEVDLPLVAFRLTYTFDAEGVVITSDSTLRFRSKDEVELNLRDAGFEVLSVREAADRPGHEYVFVARRI